MKNHNTCLWKNNSFFISLARWNLAKECERDIETRTDGGLLYWPLSSLSCFVPYRGALLSISSDFWLGVELSASGYSLAALVTLCLCDCPWLWDCYCYGCLRIWFHNANAFPVANPCDLLTPTYRSLYFYSTEEFYLSILWLMTLSKVNMQQFPLANHSRRPIYW